jgi:hypothetical protein
LNKQKAPVGAFLLNMRRKRLGKKNAICTPTSGTTVMVNYEETDHILEVEFIGGRTYHYIKVPPPVWKEYKNVINSGESSGIFVNSKIKPYYNFYEV